MLPTGLVRVHICFSHKRTLRCPKIIIFFGTTQTTWQLETSSNQLSPNSCSYYLIYIHSRTVGRLLANGYWHFLQLYLRDILKITVQRSVSVPLNFDVDSDPHQQWIWIRLKIEKITKKRYISRYSKGCFFCHL